VLIRVNALKRALLISTHGQKVSENAIWGVNALKRALLISTEKIKQIKEIFGVSMPSSGLYSFLRNNMKICSRCGGCQCPQAGFTHFYGYCMEMDKGYMWVCQCPQAGFTHFYRQRFPTSFWIQKLCQCPQAGFTHFYAIGIVETESKDGVSMPSSGLYSFLQVLDFGTEITAVCQCPQAGFTHFYKVWYEREKAMFQVSMPSSGLYSFLRYPLKNPVFMRLSGSVFVSNSQNILNSIIFHLFFGFPDSHNLIIYASPPFVKLFLIKAPHFKQWGL